MYNTIFQTHRIVVTLFLLIYLIKTVLLLMNSTSALEKFKKITKVPEMIVSVLFLGTGIYMLVQGALLNSMMIIKFVAVALSIPIAIVGFKRNNKALANLSLLLIIGAYGLAEMSKKQKSAPQAESKETTVGPATGSKIPADSLDPNGFSAAKAERLYIDNCSSCHGEDGKRGLAGAKDLTLSTMDAMEARDLITNGKGSMPGKANDLSPKEIVALVNYIHQFKKK
ncbi:MAG TPA: cytochrome c [Bacteroidia bacterium]|jgi:mono/diheme cytochrome c family protein|nr:cytochrome c [Bacteroidia bacterium]